MIDFVQKLQVDCVKPNTSNMASCFMGGDMNRFSVAVVAGVVVGVVLFDDGFVDL